jgi:hypothetical protein
MLTINEIKSQLCSCACGDSERMRALFVFCFQLVLGSRGRWVSEGAEQGSKFGSMRVKQGNALFHPRINVLFQEGGGRVSGG